MVKCCNDRTVISDGGGNFVAAGYACAYHNDKYFEKYLGRSTDLKVLLTDIIIVIRPVKKQDNGLNITLGLKSL